MAPGAIVIVEVERGEAEPSPVRRKEQNALAVGPMACVEILGRSTLERTLQQLAAAEVEVITVLAAGDVDCERPAAPASVRLQFRRVPDVPAALAQTIRQYAEMGIAHTFVLSANVYAETDLLDFFYFHRGAGNAVTRPRDQEGPLNWWMVDCAKVGTSQSEHLLQAGEQIAPSYFVAGYVRRMNHPEEIRRLATDALAARCALRPSGKEVRPGVWVDEGAYLDRRSRLVAPLYIGRNAKIGEDALITRSSSVERNCQVDYGTVIEDSSLLAHTHVGIWLDVRHAVATGNRIWSLEHEVLLEISDPAIMRSNLSRKEPVSTSEPVERQSETAVQEFEEEKEKAPAPEAWQLGANPIQG